MPVPLRRQSPLSALAVVFSFVPLVVSAAPASTPPKLEPTFPSLSKHEMPAWFEDAKLGIFIHWGIYSVPAWAPPSAPHGSLPPLEWFKNNPYAEWYLNSMRTEGSPTQKHHRETYGADFDYYRFAEDFNQGLSRWRPDEMARLFAGVHARYVVLTSKHHDGFTLWPSRVPNPHLPAGHAAATRDVVGELTAAVRAHGMRMGLYYSGGIDWSFHPVVIDGTQSGPQVTPPGADYAAYADAHWRELIERYQPVVLWNDIRYPKDSEALQIVADYYNAMPEGLVNDRWRVTPHDFTTPEYKQYDKITPKKWESCRGIGLSFGYNAVEEPKHMLTVDELVDSFVDIVSKNGNLLLNVGPKPDGTISALQVERLRGLGRWLDVNEEAIFETRPWLEAEGRLRGDSTKVRFTYKRAPAAPSVAGTAGTASAATRDTVYAILLSAPAARTITLESVVPDDGATIRLLGAESPLEWRRDGNDLVISLPSALPDSPAHALAISPQPARVMKR